MKVIILYSQFLDENGEHLKIGGIETYLMNLSKIITDLGKEVIIIQNAEIYFKRVFNGITIYGIKNNNNKNLNKLISHAESIANINSDILIFGSSIQCRKNKFKKVISIQHGIYWDVDTVHGFSKNPFSISTVLRCIQTLIEIKKQKNASTIVCVDNNYINWYRSQTIDRKQKHISIPNCAFGSEQRLEKKNNERVNIIYARRFERIRGTEIIANVMPRILEKYENINFTLAGEGSHLDMLKEKFNRFSNVEFIKYSASESISVHSKFDIAIVPSIGSEGTSLSLLEAMYSGCAVVATNVGGMTGIIIDKFNGLMVNPSVDEIYEAIEKLIVNKDLREELSLKAQETVKLGFNYNKWSEDWKNVLANA